jgi:protein ImuB
MRRVVSVWFPTLPIDRLWQPKEGQSVTHPLMGSKGLRPFAGHGQSPDSPLVTVTSRVVMAVDATSAALGLRPGMKLAQAQALVPGLKVHDADLPGDAALLRRLAEWCLRYAPLTAVDPPDGLWIDVTGGTHLHGGETRLLDDLVSRLNSQGLAARAAIADTPAVAHAVARFGSGGAVPPGKDVMAAFPIEALRLPADMLADLHLMGFERVGPLAAAARAPLARRFGVELAKRLDQAAGVLFEPIVPVAPLASIQARLGFVEPLLTAAAFSTVIASLVAQVCGDLERAGLGARRLDLRFERVDGSVQAIRIGTARPARNARHLARMLDERLECVDPGLGVETMHLIVAMADTLGFVQAASTLVAEASPDLAPLVDRLVNRLGEGEVYRLIPVESDVPERSMRQVPALTQVMTGGWPFELPRPVRLLDPPQPIDAMALLPDHPPVAFTWRRVRHRVRHADGPERIAGEWWKRDLEWASVRDYFRVEDEDGRRFWLFRRGNGSDMGTGDMRWFLHGFF